MDLLHDREVARGAAVEIARLVTAVSTVGRRAAVADVGHTQLGAGAQAKGPRCEGSADQERQGGGERPHPLTLAHPLGGGSEAQCAELFTCSAYAASSRSWSVERASAASMVIIQPLA